MEAKVHEVVMIGAGPSALTAAIYTTREEIETVLYEKGVVGGLAAITDKVDNYPGFSEGVEGMKLADELQKQAERFGAVVEFGDVTALRNEGDMKVLTIDGEEVRARSVLIASGSDYNKLGIPGEAEYYGRGVHYCATCDGAFYKDRRVVVVGGGNSAVQEAIFLTRFTSHIDLVVRSKVRASEVLQRELQKYIESGAITIHLETIPLSINADDAGKVISVSVEEGGAERDIETDGVFVFIGLKPNTAFLADSGVELDPIGHVITDRYLETAIPGVFASGDVRSGATMQIASATGEGATAAQSIRGYLERTARSK